MPSLKDLDILAVAPHPDDVELGAGGFLLKAASEGLRTGIVDLTRGELGTKGDAETREKEAEEASKRLGLSVRENLGIPDGGVLDKDPYRALLTEAIRRHRPRLLLSIHPEDRHPDHQGAAALCQSAYFFSRLPKFDTGSAAFSPSGLWFYFIHDPRPAPLVIDVSEVFELKMEVLRAYQSQFVDAITPDDYTYIGTWDYLRAVEAYGRFWGQKIGAEYGEGYGPGPARPFQGAGKTEDLLEILLGAPRPE